MKQIPHIIRWLVGGLFIFSGLIKINDPIGTSIKMEEYFEVFSTDFASFFHFFIPYALPISVILVVLEVVLGIALIIRYRENLTLYSILGLVVFFTLLTGYSAITNSVTDCGCFGDAIKLTPWQSFIKDIVLTVLILVLMVTDNRSAKHPSKFSNYLMMGITILSFFVAYWAIAHLPFIDFRAYKIGNHIPAEMQPSAPFVYEYVMEKEGKEYTFDTYPTDPSYKYVAMNHLNPEASPKITDFAVWNDEGDVTEEVFVGNKLFVVIYDVSKANEASFDAVNNLAKALGSNIEVYALTATSKEAFETFQQKNNFNIPYYFCDATVLKTIVRSNPGLWLLKDGTTVGMWHYNDVPNYSEVLGLVR